MNWNFACDDISQLQIESRYIVRTGIKAKSPRSLSGDPDRKQNFTFRVEHTKKNKVPAFYNRNLFG